MARGSNKPAEPSVYHVAERVARLRGRRRDPEGVQAEAWEWILDLKTKAASKRKAADAELNALFRLGMAPEELDGATEGVLVSTTSNVLLAPAVKMVTSLWTPWQNKRFDSVGGTGDSDVTESEAPSKLLWPFYKVKDAVNSTLALDFKTYIEPGKSDPDIEVLVLDYSGADKISGLLVKGVRDELVEIVPGVYLGKILVPLPAVSKYETIGYFALRQ
jgi:hypothetical protein